MTSIVIKKYCVVQFDANDGKGTKLVEIVPGIWLNIISQEVSWPSVKGATLKLMVKNCEVNNLLLWKPQKFEKILGSYGKCKIVIFSCGNLKVFFCN